MSTDQNRARNPHHPTTLADIVNEHSLILHTYQNFLLDTATSSYSSHKTTGLGITDFLPDATA
jgi:hypothetical protein